MRGIVQGFNTGEIVWGRARAAGMWEGCTPLLTLGLGAGRVAYWVSDNEIIVENFKGDQQSIVKTEPELAENLWLAGAICGPTVHIRRSDATTSTWEQKTGPRR